MPVEGPGGQLPLALPARAATGRADFVVSGSNRTALAQVDAWRARPGGALALTGPEGAGKSHLAAVFAAESGAAVLGGEALAGMAPGSEALRAPARAPALALEDADRALAEGGAAAEQGLFHLIGVLGAAGRPLLLTARAAPARWGVALPDLATRLAALPVARLAPPDDALMEALAAKLFADRQIRVEPGLPRYLALRVERSHAALAAAVATLDRAGLARGRPVTRRLAAEILGRDDAADMEPSSPTR
ncbi:MAG: chromosomal replication initiator DnaA [Paracoccaceae bacterium]